MITDSNVIVKEWAYRVQDGKPNPNNYAHLYHLSEILIEYKWPLSVIDEFLQNLNELDFTNQAAFDAYNKKHKMRKTTKVTIGDKETTVGAAEKPKVKPVKISRESIDSIDGETKTKALNKEEKAPGNESSVINEIGVGIGMSYISDNPDISVQELEDKLFDEMMNTKIGKSNKEKATRNACRAAAKSAKREHTRTQKTIEKNGMNSETTKVSHIWGSKDSLTKTVNHIKELGVKEVNGIPVDRVFSVFNNFFLFLKSLISDSILLNCSLINSSI